jgi:outer membrane protein OmpA-like peptidoglycan-associated protein
MVVSPTTGVHGVGLPGTAATPPTTGWISGEADKRELKRAAAAAGVPTLTDASVGYYMDVQESKLREAVDGHGIGVARRGYELTLSLPGALAFAAGSAELGAASRAVLAPIAAVLQQYDKTVIEVAGHVDATLAPGTAEALSQRRAAAVAAFLEEHGVRKARVVAVGAGAAHPVAADGSAQNRAKNDRIELNLAPLTRATG